MGPTTLTTCAPEGRHSALREAGPAQRTEPHANAFAAHRGGEQCALGGRAALQGPSRLNRCAATTNGLLLNTYVPRRRA